ncbi:MAG: Fic family protein [Candidatus Aenigmatarchaeota archaeon]
MHVEVREEGKRKKYYLAHSFRKGKKVRKLRFYLGIDLTKAELAEKKKHAEKIISERIRQQEIIHDPLRFMLTKEEIAEIKDLKVPADIRIKHLSEEAWEKFTKAFTYDTNAIEGSTITSDEVSDILQKNKLPEKPKHEIEETYGVSEAIKHIRKTREHLSLNLIRELHRIVFKGSKSFAGEFRKVEVAVVDSSGIVVHRGAPPDYVARLLSELINWYIKNRKKYTPIILAAVVHNQFENIHPFQDGNGRVGRLLLNNILIKHNLPPVNIELRNRKEYYNSLQEYENNGNLRPSIELILKEYKNLKKIIKG